MDGVADILSSLVSALWMGAIAATPVGILVGLICRIRRVGPATRHVLWCSVLASFVTPAIGSWIWQPQWFRSDRVAAVADAVLPPVVKSPGEPAPQPAAPVALEPDVVVLASSPLETNRIGESSQPATTSLGLFSSRPSYGAAQSPLVECADVASASDPECTDGHGLAKAPDETRHARVPGPSPVSTSPRASVAPPPPAAGEAAAGESLSQDLREWLLAILQARDAVVAVPPIPAAVWFGGAALLLALGALRTYAASRYVSRGRPASPEVRMLVRQVADALGLARTPDVMMVECAVSPMIWCGLRTRLILPAALWRSLDQDSRRAVVVHELAHLRRWDHVCWWAQAAIGTLYWWHPIAWWARRRLHDAAEASCDAWVTSLFPSSRKAYASALVVTKSYLSNGRGMGPALGITSGSAKKLARRITMVMTQRTAPRMSVLGGCVAAIVVALGTFVTPGLACPPEEEAAAKAAQEHAKVKAKTTKAKAPKAAGQHKSTGEAPEVTFFGEAPALEAMRGARGAQGLTVLRSRAAQGSAPAPSQPVDLEGLKEGRELREYSLPDGKLDAFFEFMSRSDVPILVERHEDGIGIWANDREHEIFEAFFKMVNPKGHSAGPGAEYEALARAQVIEAERAGVQNRANRERFRAALDAMTRDREAMELHAEQAREQAEQTRDRAEQLRELVEQLHERAGDMGGEDRAALERAVEGLRSRSEALNSESSTLDQRVADLERQMENLERQLEKLDEQLENMQFDDEGNPIGSVELTVPGVGLQVLPYVDVTPAPVPVVITVPPSAPTAPATPTPVAGSVPVAPPAALAPARAPVPAAPPVAPVAPR